MKYRIIEKTIYSEAYLLHFGDEIIYGDVINSVFPDYSGVELGEPIFETEDREEAISEKNKLEIKRLKTLGGGLNGFFDNDELAKTFYESEDFIKLQEFYNNELGLELVRKNHNEMSIKNDEFYFPQDVTDEQFLQVQKLLDLYFFEIIEEG